MKGKLIYTSPNSVAYFITKINNETHLKSYYKVIVPVVILLGYEFEKDITNNAKDNVSIIVNNVNIDVLNRIEKMLFICYEYFESRIHLLVYNKDLYIEYLTNELIYWTALYYYHTITAYKNINKSGRFSFENMLKHYKLAKYIIENTTLDSVKRKLDELCTRIRTDKIIKETASVFGCKL